MMPGLDHALAGVTRWLDTNLLVDTVRVRAVATGEPVLNPDTGQLDYPPAPVLYEGDGAVIPAVGGADRTVAPDQTQPWPRQYRSSYILLTPLTAPIPPEGALVEVVSVHDPSRAALIGRSWLASDTGQASTVEVVRRTILDQNRPPAGTP
ncbi:DUF6093 family protein [Streptomyces tanashiensis]|jgi:hypothetical protein|uniref:DUF6093 family protein n=1 Tax=Streptomyces tanashiensis TaxID=67367 RepID=UPI0036E8D85D